MKRILVCGAGGFIGDHLVSRLKQQGHYVVGADLKFPEFSITKCDKFYQRDLRSPESVAELVTNDLDEIYQLAADMGGAGYIFTGENDADIMHNSAMINLNVLHEMVAKQVPKIFYSSSACIYPEHCQLDPANSSLAESSAYPADPDSEYGWEKLFSERLYAAYARNYSIDIRIARLHNVFGPLSAWTGGREKSPAALCRKVAQAKDGVIEVWGSGNQTRSFLYIDDCVDGIERLMASSYTQPINLGSDRLISINELATLIGQLAGKPVTVNNIPGPQGVMGRNSNNDLVRTVLNWAPPDSLETGLHVLYNWIKTQHND